MKDASTKIETAEKEIKDILSYMPSSEQKFFLMGMLDEEWGQSYKGNTLHDINQALMFVKKAVGSDVNFKALYYVYKIIEATPDVLLEEMEDLSNMNALDYLLFSGLDAINRNGVMELLNAKEKKILISELFLRSDYLWDSSYIKDFANWLNILADLKIKYNKGGAI